MVPHRLERLYGLIFAGRLIGSREIVRQATNLSGQPLAKKKVAHGSVRIHIQILIRFGIPKRRVHTSTEREVVGLTEDNLVRG